MSTGLTDYDAPIPPSSAEFVWSDTMLVGFAPMDDVHKEFVEVVTALMACNEDDADRLLGAFEVHAKDHFGMERKWMLSTDFPSSNCHIDEHEAVLRSVREVRELRADGRASADLVRDLAKRLAAWFPGHADYLDSALSAWMSKRKFGGAPVVLRRSVVL